MKYKFTIALFVLSMMSPLAYGLGHKNKCSELNITSKYYDDFEKLLSALEDIHPNYAIWRGKEYIKNNIRNIRKKIPYVCNNNEFHKLVIPFIYDLGIDHLSVSGLMVNPDTMAPFSVLKLKDGYFLNYLMLNKKAQIKRGDRIISINDIAIERIWKEMSEFTEHTDNGINHPLISASFIFNMSSLYSTSKFIIKSKRGSIIRTDTVYSLSQKDYDNVDSNFDIDDGLNSYLYKNHNSMMTISYYNKIPVLKIQTFQARYFTEFWKYDEKLISEYKKHFPQIINRKSSKLDSVVTVKKAQNFHAYQTLKHSAFFYSILNKIRQESSNDILIIDLRHNLGGQDMLAMSLLNIILPTPSFRGLLPFKFERPSLQLKNYLSNNANELTANHSPRMVKYLTEMSSDFHGKWVNKIKQKRGLHGGLKMFKKIYILVNEVTSSAASIAAGIAQEYEFVEVVGVIPTGRYGLNSVLPVPVKLKNSDLTVEIPSQVYSLFEDIADFQMTPDKRKKIGIYPDYIIEPTYDDIKQKRDVILEKALMLSGFTGSMNDFKRVTFEEMLESIN